MYGGSGKCVVFKHFSWDKLLVTKRTIRVQVLSTKIRGNITPAHKVPCIAVVQQAFDQTEGRVVYSPAASQRGI